MNNHCAASDQVAGAGGFPKPRRSWGRFSTCPDQPRAGYKPAPRNSGFTVFEVIVTVALLGTVLAAMAPILRWAAEQRRESARHQLAQQEAGNILEHLAAADWDALDTQVVQAALSDRTKTLLRDAQLRVTVSEPRGTPEARRIALELTWQDRAGRRSRPVRLTTWVYRPAEGE